jgi:ribonucleotide reductase beta subunit family protein with ferritin-like domain
VEKKASDTPRVVAAADKETMQPTFDLERYLDNSQKVETRDLDFSRVRDYPVTPEEIRCLGYMMDVEAHTVMYFKSLLRTCAARDPEVVAFMSCWAYEEFFHGRAIRQFLEAAGVPIDAARTEHVRRHRSLRERLEETGAALLCHFVRDFQAVYLAWGAIQELSAVEAYSILARRTQNPILRELLQRIVKDERRHFSFYFNKARPHLRSRPAQMATAAILRRFWTPVGDGVKDDAEVRWTMQFIFGDNEGMEITRRIDACISRLPGMDWFNLLSQMREAAIAEV